MHNFNALNAEMKQIAAFFLATFALFFMSCHNSSKPKVLVFSATKAFRHASIPFGQAAIRNLGLANGFDVDTTEDATKFNDDTLQEYRAVIFLNTTGNVLDNHEEIAFERFIQAGGGFVGIHSATDTEYDWGWYGDLVGAYFVNHPDIQDADLVVVDSAQPATRFLPPIWHQKNEWYNFRNMSTNVKVLLKIDERTYKGGTMGTNHPMAWYHDFDGGRAFYTELGHTNQSYSDSLYLKHILGGIVYAIGTGTLDYSKSKSQYPPDSSHFAKTILSQGTFFEPTEMTILPNLDVLILQRRGEILLYKNDTKKIQRAGFLRVYWKSKDSTVNAEEGLLGICKDPDYTHNNWVYIFYSPVDTSVNRLSRFTMKDDSIDPASEKIILQFYSQREICCHTGGSVAFGPGNLLYLSTGDNSTPFDEPKQPYVNRGFAPLDGRPGHEKYDAERSAGNSNDLRGKIIRIKMKADGSYDIPDGNLFAANEPKTKPEIYIMGDRNPYRIAVDQKNSYLYWGEVGPDAPKDSFDTRGPRGYDEINQARKSGYFGWPFFVADNAAYHSYNYSTGVSGPAFDASHPVNNSANNTGIKDLPPAQPAFIWYPYDSSAVFPEMGAGGRCAMAGPVYYSDLYPDSSRLPDYFSGKLFIYDWIRNFIRIVTLRPNGDFYKMEPFIENLKLAAPIDIEMGPDGRIYILEYGTGWFHKNPDAGLSRIDYIK